MKVITHNLQRIGPNGYAYEYQISVCKSCESKHGLPDHVAYLGVHHGLHAGECQHSKHGQANR